MRNLFNLGVWYVLLAMLGFAMTGSVPSALVAATFGSLAVVVLSIRERQF